MPINDMSSISNIGGPDQTTSVLDHQIPSASRKMEPNKFEQSQNYAVRLTVNSNDKPKQNDIMKRNIKEMIQQKIILQKTPLQRTVSLKASAKTMLRQKSISRPKPRETFKKFEVYKPKISKTVFRWFNAKLTGEEMNKQLSSLQFKFRKYPLNIFALNRAALKIQHWFFGKRQ